MSPRTGRPLKGETKRDNRVAIKLDENEMRLLNECVDETHSTRTDVVVWGIKLVKKELDDKKEQNVK